MLSYFLDQVSGSGLRPRHQGIPGSIARWAKYFDRHGFRTSATAPRASLAKHFTVAAASGAINLGVGCHQAGPVAFWAFSHALAPVLDWGRIMRNDASRLTTHKVSRAFGAYSRTSSIEAFFAHCGRRGQCFSTEKPGRGQPTNATVVDRRCNGHRVSGLSRRRIRAHTD